MATNRNVPNDPSAETDSNEREQRPDSGEPEPLAPLKPLTDESTTTNPVIRNKTL